MSVVDHLLSSLIKHLQKTQKARKKKKKAKRKFVKKPVKAKKKPAVKKKKTVRKSPVRSKIKSDTKKKVKKAAIKSRSLPKETCIGEVTHFFSRIQVVVLKMTNGSLGVGDQIHIKGRGADFVQKTGSLQIESIDVKVARKGQLVGLKVNRAVKVGSKVYKLAK